MARRADEVLEAMDAQIAAFSARAGIPAYQAPPPILPVPLDHSQPVEASISSPARLEPWMVHGGYRLAYVWWERTQDGNDQCHDFHHDPTIYPTEGDALAAIAALQEGAEP